MKALNPQTKYYLSLSGLMALLILFYILGIHKTIAARQELIELQKLDLDPKQVLLENLELKKQNERLNTGFDQNAKLTDSERLMAFLSSNLKKEGLELLGIENSFSISKEGYTLFQLSFTVQGRFISTLKLIQKLENQGTIGQIASVRFERQFIGKRQAKLHTRITTQRMTRL